MVHLHGSAVFMEKFNSWTKEGYSSLTKKKKKDTFLQNPTKFSPSETLVFELDKNIGALRVYLGMSAKRYYDIEISINRYYSDARCSEKILKRNVEGLGY